MFLSTFSPVIFTLNKTLLLDTELDHFNLHQKVITSCKISYYYARPDFSGIRDTLQHWLGTSGFDREKCRLACTQTLFYFSFRSFRRHLRAREKEKYNVCRHLWEKWGLLSFFFPQHYPLALSWRSINPLRFIFYHLRSTDFEEKIEGLWTGWVSTDFIRFIFLLVSD